MGEPSPVTFSRSSSAARSAVTPAIFTDVTPTAIIVVAEWSDELSIDVPAHRTEGSVLLLPGLIVEEINVSGIRDEP